MKGKICYTAGERQSLSVILHAGSSGCKSTAASLLSVLLSRISTRQPLLGGSSGGDVSFLPSKPDKLTTPLLLQHSLLASVISARHVIFTNDVSQCNQSVLCTLLQANMVSKLVHATVMDPQRKHMDPE